MGADYNRANSGAQRAETAGRTGLVSERAASLSSLPEYVAKLGAKARVVDASNNALAQLPVRVACTRI
jgi:predicted double-glycine peptidase